MTQANEKTPLVASSSASESKDSVVNGKPRFSLSHSMSVFAAEHMGKIGMLGSMSIAVNSLTGPAMLSLPDQYQRSGLIPTTLTVIFVCILSALCCLHMANTISKVRGNADFKREIEYSETFERFWGHRSFVVTQILFFCCITCLNVSSIVDTAQVIDTFLGHWSPSGSGAVNFYYNDDGKWDIDLVQWDYSLCDEEMLVQGDCLPFLQTSGIVFTAGYALTLVIFVPMALMDLKENATWQIMGFLVLLVASVIFVVLFAMEGVNLENLSLWGYSWDTLFGVVLFNFALVIAVPCWLYEKEEHVDVPTVIHGASILSAVLYILIGALGAMTIPHVSPNMLESMMSGVYGVTMQLNASVFAFFIIGLGCPLFSVLTRMNLTGSGLFSKPVANVLAVYMPFFSSWLFYQGDSITQLLSWGGIIFTSVVAFILPIWIALHTLDTSDEQGVIDVYGRYTVSSKETQKFLLQILLGLSILSIAVAILGNFVADNEGEGIIFDEE